MSVFAFCAGILGDAATVGITATAGAREGDGYEV